MSSRLVRAYEFLVTFPDRLYPFANEINGKSIRGIRSYQRAVARAWRKNGAGRLGFKLELYRQTFHFLGSILFIIFSTLAAQNLLGSEAAVYALLFAAIAALTFQEFYLHPKRYKQHFGKGIIDWSFWVVPMLVYLYR